MGTQFWWFYDILAVTMVVGIGSAVISKGFNKVIFQLAAFLIAILVGILGANLIAPKVYEEMFYEKIIASVQNTLSEETFNIYQRVAESMAMSAPKEEKTPDAEELHKKLIAVRNQEKPNLEDWYLEAFSNVIEQRVNDVQKLHYMNQEQIRLAEYIRTQPPKALRDLLLCFEEESGQDLAEEIRFTIEPVYKRNYTQLVRLSLFLMIELVILIICCIISTISNNLEQSMHVRKGDHVLAVPVALVEIAVLLFVLCVTVRLIAQITDNQMLLFNEQTIQETFLFKYVYSTQNLLFGGNSV